MGFLRHFNARAVFVVGVCALAAGAVGGPTAFADPLPTWSAPVLVDPGARVRDVKCPSTSLCVAVDRSGNVLTSTHPDGGAAAWTVAHVDSDKHGIGLDAVSCVGSSLCVAVDESGNVITSTEPTGGPSAWHLVNLEFPGRLLDVSCPSISLCVVVDAGGQSLTSTNPTGGKSAWKIQHVDGPEIDGVSCPTTGLCVAADNSGNTLYSTEPTGPESAWHVAHVDPSVAFDRVACPSISLCVAVDAGENVVTSTEPTGEASAWHLAHFDPGGGDVEGISCSSTSLCVAVDSRGGALAASEPTGGVPAWTRAEIDTFALTGVSCPLAALCVAVDEGGQVVTAGAWRHGVSVLTQGTGSGSVTGSAGGLSCPGTCAASLATGTQLTLTAAAAPGSTFAGWSGGGCAGTGSCQLTLGGEVTVSATFNLPPQHTLTVSRSGSGNGTVRSSPAGIDCGATCSATFANGQLVTLTATPTSPSRFVGWGGACAGSSTTCTVTLGADQSVTAAFRAPPAVSRLTIIPKAFRAERSGPSTQRLGHRSKRGAVVRFVLSEPATMRFTVEQLLPGRKTRRGKRFACVAPTPRNRRAPRCTRTVSLRGSFTTSGHTGANSFRFTGRLAGRTLAAGSYILIATPSANDMTGSPARAAFGINP